MHTLTLFSQAYKPMQAETLYYGRAETPFGLGLFASLQDKLCWLSFEKDKEASLGRLRKQWTGQMQEDTRLAQAWSKKVLEHLATGKGPLELLILSGTAFQQAVWQALLAIPRGTTLSYQAIALAVQSPKAVRAVGQAVGANPIAIAIPCHRVVRKNGALGGFAYGTAFKQGLLDIEQRG